MDDEVMEILKRSYEEAKRLLSENREIMDQIAEFLIEKETITGKEFMQIFRKCKGIPEPEEKTASPEGFSVTGEEVPRPAEPEALHSGNEEEGQSKPLTDTDGWIPVSSHEEKR